MVILAACTFSDFFLGKIRFDCAEIFRSFESSVGCRGDARSAASLRMVLAAEELMGRLSMRPALIRTFRALNLIDK